MQSKEELLEMDELNEPDQRIYVKWQECIYIRY